MASTVFRFAVHRLVLLSIVILIAIFLLYSMNGFSLGHYIAAYYTRKYHDAITSLGAYAISVVHKVAMPRQTAPDSAISLDQVMHS